MRRGAAAREQGEGSSAVDGVDVAVGAIVLILVPILCLVAAYGLGIVQTRSEKYDFREKVATDPAPDREEVEMRIRSAQDLYYKDSRPFLEAAEAEHKKSYGIYFRRWAKQSLETVDASLATLDALIRKYPDSSASFQDVLGRIAQLRSEVQRDVGRAAALDVMGLDARPGAP